MQEVGTLIQSVFRKRAQLFAAFVAACALTFAVGCGQKGEMEKAGENIDEAADKAMDHAEDMMDSDGAMEEAGEQVDDAAEEVTQ